MAQELGISEKDSDFQNPFKVDHTEVSSGAYGCVCPASAGPGSQALQGLGCLWGSVRALDLGPDMPGSGSRNHHSLTSAFGQATALVLASGHLSVHGMCTPAVGAAEAVNSRHPRQVDVREARGGQVMLFSVLSLYSPSRASILHSCTCGHSRG